MYSHCQLLNEMRPGLKRFLLEFSDLRLFVIFDRAKNAELIVDCTGMNCFF